MKINNCLLPNLIFILQLCVGTLALKSCSHSSSSTSSTYAETDEIEQLANNEQSEGNGAPSMPQRMSPSPMPYQVMQPDGTKIMLLLKGSACLHWEEDDNGYSVVQKNKRYFYAKKAVSGQLEPSEFEVGKHAPSTLGLKKHLSPIDDGLCTINN